MTIPKLMIVIPAYNEEEMLNKSLGEIDEVLTTLIKHGEVASSSKLLVVNDGSADLTWQIITDNAAKNEHITGINFSRNFGHQNAIIGGLTAALDYGDIFITIDADLQDDINAIYEMVQQYHAGYDVVYGVRNSRKTDTAFKRTTAESFYTLMKKIGVEMVPDSADYRLMSKRAVEHLLEYKESNLFLRGIVPKIGFPSTKVYYARKPREAGTSKYPLKKMLLFAWDGITSFSVAPMRLILSLGIITVFISIVMTLYTLVQHVGGNTKDGWSSLMVSLWFIGGVQLVSLSVLGEYIGKVFNEVKHRPRFIIQDNLLDGANK
ncbi:glycosyltransferase family 2 protein [Leuconostoc fallax]|uniref:Glycosyltransferase 2-like domain-containing protein n=1 Tax=Leuconostoc fallax TaxID=1251 RepID=A0A4R5N7U4_9LACO|nr:glycosyltransferase family 2 protein [Leuconostoc fallax]MBU7455802.1 glycosyltransferase family 2 protein [Leuconostoc fallax]MCO6184004.1 glycosyltransferase family 2 protein [Leuconostoc fallax]TDG67956.1 hypothetical protein C5L23_000262 [Leuconostoc fallax]